MRIGDGELVMKNGDENPILGFAHHQYTSPFIITINHHH